MPGTSKRAAFFPVSIGDLHQRCSRPDTPDLVQAAQERQLEFKAPQRVEAVANGFGRATTWRLSRMPRHWGFSCCARGVGTVQDAIASAPSRHTTRAQMISPPGLGSARRSSKSTVSPDEILFATRVRGGPPHASINSEA